MRLTCGKCHSLLEIPDSSVVSDLACPVCKASLMAEKDGAVSAENDKAHAKPKRKGGFFSEVFKSHDASEIEEYFMVGSARTTPDVFSVDLSWPRPWMFARLLFAGVLTYWVLVKLFENNIIGLNNVSSIPNIFIVGSFAVPLASAVLFFELNARRNVSLYQVLKLIFAGGISSLLLATLFFGIEPWLIKAFGIPEAWHSALAGPVEETAKIVAVLLVMRGTKYRYALNGLLFGAAVGVGFAMFESAGYALRSFLQAYAIMVAKGTMALSDANQLTDAAFHAKVITQSMAAAFESLNRVITLRGVLAPIGHVAYSAIAVGALWRVKGGRPFSLPMLWDFRFVSLFLVAVACHAFWNSPCLDAKGIPWLKAGVVAAIEWSVIGLMIRDGLNQIRREQEEIVGDDR